MKYYKDANNHIYALDEADFIENEEGELSPVVIKATENLTPITEEEKNSILEAIIYPEPEFYTCSPWQIRKALNRIELREQIESTVSGSTDQELIDGWNHASFFRSDDPFVISMGQVIGKDPAAVKDLIKWAATL